MIISPSILSADFAHLGNEVKMLNESKSDWIHVDVMDGNFVPNYSMGMPVIEAIKKHSTKPLDVHLMIIQPERYIAEFASAGASSISVHLEACIHLHRVVQQIHHAGCRAGVAINPHTPVCLLSEIIGDIELVCVMSVNPGFGGQQFIENTYKKVRELKYLIVSSGSHALIEIDGGVNLQNAPLLKAAGADVLVAGNFIFSAQNPHFVIGELKAV